MVLMDHNEEATNLENKLASLNSQREINKIMASKMWIIAKHLEIREKNKDSPIGSSLDKPLIINDEEEQLVK